jgi:TrmH family RNA methyltransferase
MMKTITSRQNVWFKRVRDAIREHGAEIVIEGPKAVADAIDAAWKPIAVIGIEAGDFVFSRELFKAVSDTRTSQGVIGLFERPRASAAHLFARKETIVVALDAVQDPGNVGTIVRLAAAFDAAGIALLPGCADPFSPKSIRASAGAILHVPVVPLEVTRLLASGLPLYIADAGGRQIDPPVRGAILAFGSEGRGVSEALRARATPIAIASSGRVESLNVAAAAAILLWRSFCTRTGS